MPRTRAPAAERAGGGRCRKPALGPSPPGAREDAPPILAPAQLAAGITNSLPPGWAAASPRRCLSPPGPASGVQLCPCAHATGGRSHSHLGISESSEGQRCKVTAAVPNGSPGAPGTCAGVRHCVPETGSARHPDSDSTSHHPAYLVTPPLPGLLLGYPQPSSMTSGPRTALQDPGCRGSLSGARCAWRTS